MKQTKPEALITPQHGGVIIAVDDDQDRNRLVVDIYFYVVGVPGPQVVQTFLQRVR